MHCQMFSCKIDILFEALFYLFNFYGFPRASACAFRQLGAFTYAIIAFSIQIGNKILENNTKGTGN